jgi:hypothetical protein
VTVRRILVLFLLSLSFTTIAAADELQISFSNVDVTKQIPAFSGMYSGSWIWDTSTDTISDVMVQSTGPADFNGAITWSAEFGRGLGQPAGTSDLFLLSILTADQTASLNFFPQDSLLFLPPTPGQYDSLAQEFFVNCVSATCSVNTAQAQSGKLSVVKVAEPGVLALTAIGFVFLFSLLGFRRRGETPTA